MGLFQALAHLHSKGIAHLDINPNNIMCNDDNHLVLIDFGLSKHCSEEPISPCGTPGYIAPEVYTGNAVGTCVDIYSAGIILGSLLEPYVPDCYLNYLGCRCEMDTHSLSTLINSLEAFDQERCYNIRPAIVYEAVNLLQRMLNPNPNLRISAADALNHPFLTASPADFQGTDINTYTSTLQLIRYHRSLSASPASSYEYEYY
ncbi:kinase-like protein [Basidiobolus meristosporus CBS 931.73]|uniref:Kinase-like protein n=1 Tax=Basidiobolus meristosporus CBS 931.73 TaxID=1314790 RepID=A0A1Y1YJ51_9FUNG|nr:kinase-like protein [Basidiobolus meristosporus CBS 931.73]|eukprot:ORX98057.1 kinase-like protein [Basidiobolus meristosporus CBS 931.73]